MLVPKLLLLALLVLLELLTLELLLTLLPIELELLLPRTVGPPMMFPYWPAMFMPTIAGLYWFMLPCCSCPKLFNAPCWLWSMP